MPPKEAPYEHEQDSRWTAVDDYQFPHLYPESRPLHSALDHAIKNSASQGLEEIAVYPSQGRFVALQCQIIKAQHILEIGTLGGYSTIWLASSDPDARVVTVECDPHAAKVARQNIAFAGLSDRIEVIVGEASEVLSTLVQRPKFDFVFIDADKEGYPNYFKWAVEHTRTGGLIYFDDMVRKGLLANEEEARKGNPKVVALRQVVEDAGKDDRIDAVILQTVGAKNYDGFMLALVK